MLSRWRRFVAGVDERLAAFGRSKTLLEDVLAEVPDEWLETEPMRRRRPTPSGRRTSSSCLRGVSGARPWLPVVERGMSDDLVGYQYVVLRCVPRVDARSSSTSAWSSTARLVTSSRPPVTSMPPRLRALDPRPRSAMPCRRHWTRSRPYAAVTPTTGNGLGPAGGHALRLRHRAAQHRHPARTGPRRPDPRPGRRARRPGRPAGRLTT